MKGTGKLLTVVFAVLFIVLLGEVGYVIYSFSKPKAPTTNKEVSNLTNEQINKVSQETGDRQAIDDAMLIALAKTKRGVLVSSILNITYQGTITELAQDDDGMKVRIKGVNGDENAFFFAPERLSKTTFTRREAVNNQTTKIKSTDLAVGDLIRIEGQMDMLKELKDSFNTATITVIKQ